MSVRSQDESIASDWLQLSLCRIKNWTDTQPPMSLLFLLSCNRIMAPSEIAPRPFPLLSSWFKTSSTMSIAQVWINWSSVNGFLTFARFQATRKDAAEAFSCMDVVLWITATDCLYIATVTPPTRVRTNSPSGRSNKERQRLLPLTSVARAPLFEVRGVRFTHSPYWYTSVTLTSLNLTPIRVTAPM